MKMAGPMDQRFDGVAPPEARGGGGRDIVDEITRAIASIAHEGTARRVKVVDHDGGYVGAVGL